MRQVLFAAAGALCLAACVGDYPQSVSEQGANQSVLFVEGAPVGTMLRVDGITYGQAERYDRGAPLAVTPGRHKVELVSADGRVLRTEDVFVGRGGTASVSY